MTTAMDNKINLSNPNVLWIAIGLNLIWINLSEVFRYFVFVMPMMHDRLALVRKIWRRNPNCCSHCDGHMGNRFCYFVAGVVEHEFGNSSNIACSVALGLT